MTPDIARLIDRALEEDLSLGDVTTDALVPPALRGKAVIVAKAGGVLAGVEAALAVFTRLDGSLKTTALQRDGDPTAPGSVIAEIEGPVASILRAERTALNLLQRLSGIATDTSRYVRAVAGHKAKIVDTRKTTPGLRSLEKAAVRAGGGSNHRRNLGDGILIKDNHIDVLRRSGISLKQAVEMARANAPHTLRVEVEVENLDDVREALDGGADIIMLDNMDLEMMTQAVSIIGDRALIEASGGISLATVRDVAATGVDLISVGALTHSPRALDLSLEFV